MEVLTKDDLSKINTEVELLKFQFQNAMMFKDYKKANEIANKIGSIVKKVKKYEKFLKESGEVINEE